MNQVYYTKYAIHIDGIYGWGKGYLDPSFDDKWERTVKLVHENGPFCAKNANLCPSRISGGCTTLTSGDFYAYMHPMAIEGHIMSSEYTRCTEAEWQDKMRDSLNAIVDVIKADWGEVVKGVRIVARTFVMDFDNPKSEICF